MTLRDLIEAALRLWADSQTPEVGSSPNRMAALASGHVLIGMALAAVIAGALGFGGVDLGIWTAGPAWLVYALGKEVGDLIRDGDPRDSLADSGLVMAGACVWWMPPLLAVPFFGLAILIDQQRIKP